MQGHGGGEGFACRPQIGGTVLTERTHCQQTRIQRYTLETDKTSPDRGTLGNEPKSLLSWLL